jgi:hypothetical protein
MKKLLKEIRSAIADSPAMWVSLAGVATLHRSRESGWYLGVVSVALNVTAWWLRLMQIDWAAIRSAFDS